MRGIISIIIGVVFIIGGLSGRLVLIGTNNGPALAVLGAVIIVIGVIRVAKSRG